MEFWTDLHEYLLVEGGSDGLVSIGAWRDAPGGDFDGKSVDLTRAQTLRLIAELQRLVAE